MNGGAYFEPEPTNQITGFDEDDADGKPTPTLVSDFDWDHVEVAVFGAPAIKSPIDSEKILRAETIRDCAEKLRAKNRMGTIIASLLFQWRAGVFPEVTSLSSLADKFDLNKQTLYQASRRIYHDDWGIDIRSDAGCENIAIARRKRPRKTLPANATQPEATNEETGSGSVSSPIEAPKVNGHEKAPLSSGAQIEPVLGSDNEINRRAD